MYTCSTLFILNYLWEKVCSYCMHDKRMGLYEILPKKDTIRHKTLETMCNVRAWPQQCWKSCANGSNIVTLRLGHHGTKYIFGVVGLKVLPVSNFAQQLLTTTQQRKTCNRMCKRTQHVTCNNVASVCMRLTGNEGHDSQGLPWRLKTWKFLLLNRLFP